MAGYSLKPLSTGWRLPCVEKVATARNAAVAALSARNPQAVAKAYAKARHHQKLYMGFAAGEMASVLASPRAPVHLFLSRRSKATQRACAQYLKDINEADFAAFKQRCKRRDHGFRQGAHLGLTCWLPSRAAGVKPGRPATANRRVPRFG